MPKHGVVWGQVNDSASAGNNCLHYSRRLMFIKHIRNTTEIPSIVLILRIVRWRGLWVNGKSSFPTRHHSICNISLEIYFHIRYLMSFPSLSLFSQFVALRKNLIIVTSTVVSFGQIKSNNETCSRERIREIRWDENHVQVSTNEGKKEIIRVWKDNLLGW